MTTARLDLTLNMKFRVHVAVKIRYAARDAHTSLVNAVTRVRNRLFAPHLKFSNISVSRL
jgi:hypothetical protein